MSDAQDRADTRAAELSQRLQDGEGLNHYDYGDGAIREEIVQTLGPDQNAPIAVVTRNAYGALVLNAASAMFIDVDFPAHSKVGSLFRGLMGKKTSDPQESALAGLRDWAKRHGGLGMRIYRTCAGLRALVTSRTFDPTDSSTIDLLRDAASDPLYIRLCQNQQCFRARLTPKPWRCNFPKPPSRYPWQMAAQESAFRVWQSKYEQKIQAYCACRFIEHVGGAGIDVDIQPVLALHDQISGVSADRPLA